VAKTAFDDSNLI